VECAGHREAHGHAGLCPGSSGDRPEALPVSATQQRHVCLQVCQSARARETRDGPSCERH
jgi:hypothetical protein